MEQNNYCLTLTHHGIKGMKWGVRRTAAQLGHKVFKKKQKPRADDDDDRSSNAAPAPRKKSMSEMSDQELQAAINRARLEQTYLSMYPRKETLVDKGKKYAAEVMHDVVWAGAKEAGRGIVRDKLSQLGKKYLGLESGDDDESAFKKLKRAAEIAENKAKIINNEKKTKEYDEKYGGKPSDSDPKPESTPKTDSKPESTPKSDSKPKVESTPKSDSKPKVESTPKSDSKPKAESTSSDRIKGKKYKVTKKTVSTGKAYVSEVASETASSITGKEAFVSNGRKFIDITDLINK